MTRIGQGYDVHRLAEGRKLILGGVEIPYERGLLGHSDADVLTHAVMDALLGAAALGDIGCHFPDSDPAYAGADSLALLDQVMQLLHAEGWQVENVDATILAQRPKLAPYLGGYGGSSGRSYGSGAGTGECQSDHRGGAWLHWKWRGDGCPCGLPADERITENGARAPEFPVPALCEENSKEV